MDPCPFVRLNVESLALKLPLATKPAGSRVHPSNTPRFCKVRIKNFPSQTAILPFCSTTNDSPPDTSASAAGFHLDSTSIRRLSGKPITLRVEVYTGRMGHTCGVGGGKLLGSVQVSVDLGHVQSNPRVFQNGWLKLGNQPDKPAARLHLVRWRTFPGEKERAGRERKGWMIMVYDLSGSPVAVASMITPFVPLQGADRVSRSNPGAWLILRPNGFSVSSWKPWGRLEAWRERGPIDGLSYKFELVTDNGGPSGGIPIAEATMSVRKGGQFCIDSRIMKDSGLRSRSPVNGFVMGSTVEGEGKVSKPVVQVGVQYVTCIADAALFIALSAAVDLSMDACRLFSHKLRKELCHDEQEFFS
ncbi:hypothetical protein GH714_026210 [Hevea brasiliensis]|uniref:DUF1005 domain-containing protein n=1 Tax=Hevea brasiliensis TaxID=3981 RepID=A0A6A6LRF8_HEVBR|nr:hypothetical protein GH714_026210 [Hevea brasiliensis]